MWKLFGVTCSVILKSECALQSENKGTHFNYFKDNMVNGGKLFRH